MNWQMTLTSRLFLNLGALAIVWSWATVIPSFAQDPAKPVNCASIAFDSARWTQEGASLDMFAWEGKRVVLLTKTDDLDRKLVRDFVDRLDQAWKLYSNIIGKTPTLLRQYGGKPTICAIPKPNLSCGYGCGYVGATGIEVAGFYDQDWPKFEEEPKEFAHYYFYEMGRNFYVFEDRHSLFTTGYAVFMRYVCMDTLQCEDADIATRKTIEGCEQIYAESNIRFLDAFTNLTTGEKGHRLRDAVTNQPIVPSDQPVMYATAMLKLRKDYGGDSWTKRFFYHLHKCPTIQAVDEKTALNQSLNWLVCASAAAGQDLSPVFVNRWRMPLSEAQLAIISTTSWDDPKLSVAPIVQALVEKSQ
jgi:hypothetical protein